MPNSGVNAHVFWSAAFPANWLLVTTIGRRMSHTIAEEHR
jgi:hypothetical protein